MSLSPVASFTPLAAPTGAATVASATAGAGAAAVKSAPVPPHPMLCAMKGAMVPAKASLTAIEVSRGAGALRILIKASGPISGSAANLSRPDRILVKISGAGWASSRLAKVHAVNVGAVKRVRFAIKGASETWVVVDLASKVAFRTAQPTRDSFELVLPMAGGAVKNPSRLPKEAAAPATAPASVLEASPAPAASALASVPKINVMLFDLDVIYQGKEYKRFPCANFIYNVGERFPLKRSFVSTLVFSRGYGAFVGNIRVLDPEGHLLARTETPFGFNLVNSLAEYFVEQPWDVEFREKGSYTLCVDLNGSEILKQAFYVGQTTDIPPAL